MKVVALLIAAVTLLGCGENEELKASRERWDGAVVVKICRSGTFIYRLKDGRFFAGGLGMGQIEDPQTVCE